MIAGEELCAVAAHTVEEARIENNIKVVVIKEI
jgi:hypothetical protein